VKDTNFESCGKSSLDFYDNQLEHRRPKGEASLAVSTAHRVALRAPDLSSAPQRDELSQGKSRRRRGEDVLSFELLCIGFDLINIPACPNELSFEKVTLRTS
jgi:hypothetical protein